MKTILIKPWGPSPNQARIWYEKNKKFVTGHMDNLSSMELCRFAREQDRLYLRMNNEA